MPLSQEIKEFDEKYKEFLKENDELTEQLTTAFEALLVEIQPVIYYMKKNNFYFFHPDLDHSINTSVGVIIGRNSKNNHEVFVYDGLRPLIQRVNVYVNHEEAADGVLTFTSFFGNCDLQFALNGIEHTKNYLSFLLDELNKSNEKKASFLKQIKSE